MDPNRGVSNLNGSLQWQDSNLQSSDYWRSLGAEADLSVALLFHVFEDGVAVLIAIGEGEEHLEDGGSERFGEFWFGRLHMACSAIVYNGIGARGVS